MSTNSVDGKRDVQKEIAELIAAQPVVIFMKGTPDAPQCGFSMRASQILSKYFKGYTAVDVLSDAAVRQGIKEYSDWPTIPQVFISGQFVGGSDILIEMDESGELAGLAKDV